MRGGVQRKITESGEWSVGDLGDIRAMRFLAGLLDNKMGRAFMGPILT